MSHKTSQFFFASVCLVFAGSLLTLTCSQAANQRNSRLDAAGTHEMHADQSMQGSTIRAMQAMNALGAGDYSGAKRYGEESYAMYNDAKLMNALADKSEIEAMRSRSNLDPKEVFGFQFRRTTYANLKPDFLYQGEAAKVARQFEKNTGMSRSKFLKAMSVTTEKPLTGSETSQYLQAFGRFKQFVATIPNEKFRKKLQKNINKLPAKIAVNTISKSVLNSGLIPHGVGTQVAGISGNPNTKELRTVGSTGGTAYKKDDGSSGSSERSTSDPMAAFLAGKSKSVQPAAEVNGRAGITNVNLNEDDQSGSYDARVLEAALKKNKEKRSLAGSGETLFALVAKKLNKFEEFLMQTRKGRENHE